MAAILNLVQLKEIVDALLNDAIARSDGGNIVISDNRDFYWDFLSKDLFVAEQKPGDLVLGRLSDDIAFLLPLLENKEQILSVMFIHVAPILRYLGEREIISIL